MKIVRPSYIDADAKLISSNAGETVAAYNAGTTYPLAAQVRSDATHRIYESVQAGNVGHALTDPAWWLDVGPANTWAMFDQINGTATVGAAGLDVTVKPDGRIDSIALLNVDAAEVRVIVTDATDGMIHDQTYSMASDSGITDWYAYFYEPIIRKTDLIVSGFLLYAAPTIRVIVSAGGSPVSVGNMVMGQSREIGSTGYGAQVGINDYSRKEADGFGNYMVVERAFSKKASFNLLIDASAVDNTQTLLAAYRATPILYIGADAYGSTAVFGFYKSFDITIAYPNHSLCNLEIEGLT